MTTLDFLKENWPYLVAIGGWLFTLGTMVALLVTWKQQLTKLEERVEKVEQMGNAWLTIVNNFNNLVKLVEDGNKAQDEYRKAMREEVGKINDKFVKYDDNIAEFWRKGLDEAIENKLKK